MESAIVAGRVQVDGVTVTKLGTRVDPTGHLVELDGRPVAVDVREPLVLVVNKPRGVLTTVHDPHGRPTVMDVARREAQGRRVYPTGRLDLDSDGLVLLTDDGALAHRLTHPRFGHEREYQVTFGGPAPHDLAQQFRVGVDIGDTRPAHGAVLSVRPTQSGGEASLVLTEGRNRQVRRMFAALGLQVTRLRRVRIACVRLGDLQPGHTRRLSPDEVRVLAAAAGISDGSSAAIDQNASAPPVGPGDEAITVGDRNGG